MSYQGVPRETFDYLAALKANNDRNWFEAHRTEYERYWLESGLDLIAALAPMAAETGLLAVPKLNQSLRRIHRDTRFSKDKSPYQPWLHVILSTGPAFNKAPGMHIVLTPDGLGYGAGRYEPGPEVLNRLRGRMMDGSERAALLGAVAEAGRVGSTLDPPDLARVPKGFTAPPEWDDLLRRRSVIVRRQTPLPPPDWLFTDGTPARLAEIVAAHLPLLRWLSR